MTAIDLKEIPVANAGADRDKFEQFARDFLVFRGFRVLAGPDRGADGGRDLIVEERRIGVGGETTVRWLVSCKHKAHSGSSVTPDDELDIRDRLATHDCTGFIGFYSTLPSSGLAGKLNANNLPYEVVVFDGAKIDAILLDSPAGIALARRYCPVSTDKWCGEHPKPAKLFSEDPELNCKHCGKSLLFPEPSGIVVIWSELKEDYSTGNFLSVYWCCKGGCDSALERRHYRKGVTDGWEDIPDLIAPVAYLRWFITVLNEQNSGLKYSDEAFDAMKDLLINLFPLVSRDLTLAEKDRIRSLSQIPKWLGGWGA